jgi:hypothetical protein
MVATSNILGKIHSSHLRSRLGISRECSRKAFPRLSSTSWRANNSEYLRHNSDSLVDEHTLREIYRPSFEAAVKQAHVGAIMDSYNLINGQAQRRMVTSTRKSCARNGDLTAS